MHLPLTNSPYWFCRTIAYLLFGLPCSILGLILALIATFSNQCNCCKSSCCCSCCSESFEFGALVTSSPHTPYILGPDGKLVKEGETDIEANKDSGDLILSSSATSNIILRSETEVELEADQAMREEEEAH